MLPHENIQETSFSLSNKAPLPPERRRDTRQMTILRVGTLILEDRRELCLVRNISGGGLMAHTYSEFDPGQPIKVELKTNHPIDGTITWVEESNVGIEFAQPIDVVEMLHNPARLDNGWRPRMPRIEIDRLATLRVGGRMYWVSALDISQGGVKIETDQRLEPGCEIVLTFDKFRPIAGVVRWQKDGCCGITFNQVVPFGELSGWLRAQA